VLLLLLPLGTRLLLQEVWLFVHCGLFPALSRATGAARATLMNLLW